MQRAESPLGPKRKIVPGLFLAWVSDSHCAGIFFSHWTLASPMWHVEKQNCQAMSLQSLKLFYFTVSKIKTQHRLKLTHQCNFSMNSWVSELLREGKQDLLKILKESLTIFYFKERAKNLPKVKMRDWLKPHRCKFCLFIKTFLNQNPLQVALFFLQTLQKN